MDAQDVNSCVFLRISQLFEVRVRILVSTYFSVTASLTEDSAHLEIIPKTQNRIHEKLYDPLPKGCQTVSRLCLRIGARGLTVGA